MLDAVAEGLVHVAPVLEGALQDGFGHALEQVAGDVADEAFTGRVVENLIFALPASSNVRAAILPAPLIYGVALPEGGVSKVSVRFSVLPLEKWHAGIGLSRLRLAVLRRATFDDVGDVDLLARQPHGPDHVVQQLPGAAHKGQPLRVLVRTWSLTDETKLCVRIPSREDGVGPRLREDATPAGLHFFRENVVLEQGNLD